MSLLKDSFFIVTALLVFIIAAVTVGLIWGAFNNALQTSDVAQQAKDGVSSINNAWGPTMDWFFAALLFGLPLASMGLAYFNKVPAVFFYLVIGVMLLMLFVGAGIQQGWVDIQAGNTAFSTYAANNMPIANFILTHFIMYGVLVVAIIGWGTYVKTRESPGGSIGF